MAAGGLDQHAEHKRAERGDQIAERLRDARQHHGFGAVTAAQRDQCERHHQGRALRAAADERPYRHEMRQQQHAKAGDQHGSAGGKRRADLVAAHVHEFRNEQAGENADALEDEQMHAGGGGVVADGRRDGRHPVGHGVEGGRLQSHEGRHVPRHRTAQHAGEHAMRRLRGTCRSLCGMRVLCVGRRAAIANIIDIASIAGFDGAAGGSDNDFAIVQDTQRPQHGDDQRRHTPEGE